MLVANVKVIAVTSEFVTTMEQGHNSHKTSKQGEDFQAIFHHIRGQIQIDVWSINSHVTAGLCFAYLGSYESSEHDLSNEVW